MTVTTSQIEQIVNDVWASYTDVKLRIPQQRLGEQGPPDEMLTGRVFVNGAWRGSIEVECSRPLAVRAAASMLGSAADDVNVTDLKDALGELTNIIGGNIKSLLPGPSHLSLPAVWEGAAPVNRPTHDRMVDRAMLKADENPVRITVWQTLD